jgi:hypothetical protein
VIVRYTTEDAWAGILFTDLPRGIFFSVSTDSSFENTENGVLGTGLTLNPMAKVFRCPRLYIECRCNYMLISNFSSSVCVFSYERLRMKLPRRSRWC